MLLHEMIHGMKNKPHKSRYDKAPQERREECHITADASEAILIIPQMNMKDPVKEKTCYQLEDRGEQTRQKKICQITQNRIMLCDIFSEQTHFLGCAEQKIDGDDGNAVNGAYRKNQKSAVVGGLQDQCRVKHFPCPAQERNEKSRQKKHLDTDMTSVGMLCIGFHALNSHLSSEMDRAVRQGCRRN